MQYSFLLEQKMPDVPAPDAVAPGTLSVGSHQLIVQDNTQTTQYWTNRVSEASLGRPFLMDSETPKNSGDASISLATTHSANKNVQQTFPEQLFEALSDETLSDVVEWLPHGQGWIIRDKQRFASEVLPRYFEKKSKWTSFTRKLNRWRFTRVTRGLEVGAYYHSLFQRGNKELCLKMTCMGSKVSQSLEPLNPVALGLATPNMVEKGLLSTASRSGDQCTHLDHHEFPTAASLGTARVHSSGQPPYPLHRLLHLQQQVSNPLAAALMQTAAHNQHLQDTPIALSVPSSQLSINFGQTQQQNVNDFTTHNFQDRESNHFPMVAMLRQHQPHQKRSAFPFTYQQEGDNSFSVQHTQISSCESSTTSPMDQILMELRAKDTQHGGAISHPGNTDNGIVPSSRIQRDPSAVTQTTSGMVRQHAFGRVSNDGDNCAIAPEDQDQYSPSIFDDSSGSEHNSEDNVRRRQTGNVVTQTLPLPDMQQPQNTYNLKPSNSSNGNSHQAWWCVGNDDGMSSGGNESSLHSLSRNLMDAMMLWEQRKAKDANTPSALRPPEDGNIE